MYRRAQICAYLLVWTVTASWSSTTNQPDGSVAIVSCPVACICLSPKQVLCNNGGLHEIPTHRLPFTVEELSLGKNNFTTIHADAFQGMQMLRKLNLNENNISSIRPFAFRGLPRLRELSIQQTPLPHIEPFSFAALQNLTLLMLANNKIRYIESHAFAGMTNVQFILLSNNPLVRVASNAFTGLTHVERLILPTGVRIIEPDAFAGLEHVRLLKLAFMDLKCLASYTFRGLRHVYDLNIQDSDLGVIERDAFYGLNDITHLNMMNNKVDHIQRFHLTRDMSIRMFRFHGNHVLEAPHRPRDILLQVQTVSVVNNHFPCDCQAHNILESNLVNSSRVVFSQRNYCISPMEYNGKPMSHVDLDGIARCHDDVVQDNLGSGAPRSERITEVIAALLYLILFL